MERERMQLLDYGRFAAAAAVLAFHYFFNGIANGKLSSLGHEPVLSEVARYGYLGVNFFFLISGYVILLSARGKSAHEFAVARALRLYPAFCFAVLLTSAVALLWGGQRMSVSLSQVAANLTMAAPWFGQDYVDGVYWTLSYELRFYAAVLLALLLGAARRLEVLCGAWVGLQLLAHALGLQHLPLLGSYYVYFAAGALLAVLKNRPRPGPWLPLLLGALYLCASFAMEEAGERSLATGHAISPWVAAASVLGFFVFFGVLNTPQGSALRLPSARLVGGLTYPLYLIHAHVGYMLLSRFASEEHKVLAYALVIAAVLAIALYMHLVIERAMAPMWRVLFVSAVGAPLQALQHSARRLFAAPRP